MSKNCLIPPHHRLSPDWKYYQRLLQNGKQASALFCLLEEAGSPPDHTCWYHSAESLQRGAVGKLKPHGGTGMHRALVPASHHLAFGKLGIPRASPGHPELLVPFLVCMKNNTEVSASKVSARPLLDFLLYLHIWLIYNDSLNWHLKVVLSPITGSDKISMFPFHLHLKERQLLPTIIFYILIEL